MKKGTDYIDKLLEEVSYIAQVRKQEGESAAKCRHEEIVATVLLLIHSSLRRLCFGIFCLLGALIAYLLG